MSVNFKKNMKLHETNGNWWNITVSSPEPTIIKKSGMFAALKKNRTKDGISDEESNYSGDSSQRGSIGESASEYIQRQLELM